MNKKGALWSRTPRRHELIQRDADGAPPPQLDASVAHRGSAPPAHACLNQPASTTVEAPDSLSGEGRRGRREICGAQNLAPHVDTIRKESTRAEREGRHGSPPIRGARREDKGHEKEVEASGTVRAEFTEESDLIWNDDLVKK